MPLQGWPLGSLTLLWVLGRLAVALCAWSGPAVAMVADVYAPAINEGSP